MSTTRTYWLASDQRVNRVTVDEFSYGENGYVQRTYSLSDHHELVLTEELESILRKASMFVCGNSNGGGIRHIGRIDDFDPEKIIPLCMNAKTPRQLDPELLSADFTPTTFVTLSYDLPVTCPTCVGNFPMIHLMGGEYYWIDKGFEDGMISMEHSLKLENRWDLLALLRVIDCASVHKDSVDIPRLCLILDHLKRSQNT